MQQQIRHFTVAKHTCYLGCCVQERIAQAQHTGGEDRPRQEDGGEERGSSAVVKATHLSLVDASHTTAVTDLQWLPGLAFTRDGRPPTATKV